MNRIPKQEYTAQFKDQAVAMVKGGKTVAEAARALGLVEQTLRNWVKLAARPTCSSTSKCSTTAVVVTARWAPDPRCSSCKTGSPLRTGRYRRHESYRL